MCFFLWVHSVSREVHFAQGAAGLALSEPWVNAYCVEDVPASQGSDQVGSIEAFHANGTQGVNVASIERHVYRSIIAILSRVVRDIA